MEQELKKAFEKLLDASIAEAKKKEGKQKTESPNIKTISMPYISIKLGDKDFGLVCNYVNAAVEDGTMLPLRCDVKNGVYDTLSALPQYNATVSMKFTKESYLSVDIF